MIREQGKYRSEERKEMRGGSGSVRIEHLFECGTEMLSPARLCGRLTLEPGCSIGFHRHENEEELFFIIRGEAEIDDNGTVKKVSAGDAVLTGNGAGHAVRNIGTSPLEILAVITQYPEQNK